MRAIPPVVKTTGISPTISMKKTLFVIKTLILAFLLLSLASIPGGFAMGFSFASNPGASTDTPVFLTITLIGEIIVPIYLLIYYRAKNNLDALDVVMPFKKDKIAQKFGVGYLIGFLAFAIIFAIAVFGGGFTTKIVWSSKNIVLFVLMLIGFLIQGTTEEIVCRGYVQGRITEKLGVFWAIALSALFFASGHLGNAGVSLEGFVGLLAFGILTALLRFYTGDLWLCGALHGAWNFAEGPFFGTPVSGISGTELLFKSTSVPHHPWLNGGAFGIEASLTCIIVLILLSVLTVYLGQKYSVNKLDLN